MVKIFDKIIKDNKERRWSRILYENAGNAEIADFIAMIKMIGILSVVYKMNWNVDEGTD